MRTVHPAAIRPRQPESRSAFIELRIEAPSLREPPRPSRSFDRGSIDVDVDFSVDSTVTEWGKI